MARLTGMTSVIRVLGWSPGAVTVSVTLCTLPHISNLQCLSLRGADNTFLTVNVRSQKHHAYRTRSTVSSQNVLSEQPALLFVSVGVTVFLKLKKPGRDEKGIIDP